MIENNKKINYFETKQEFLKKIESIEKKIKILKSLCEKQQKTEINRLSKEFDFQNYERKYNISPFYVFSALFGVKNALQILMRNGMIKKEKIIL